MTDSMKQQAIQDAVMATRLEQLICEPEELSRYITTLNPAEPRFAHGMSDEEFGECLSQIENDHRRLHSLNAEQLKRLSGDAASLLLLADNVAGAGASAWDLPMSRVGGCWLSSKSWNLPTWEHIQAADGSTKPLAAPEMPAPLGEVLETAPRVGGRAVLFERQWKRPIKTLLNSDDGAVPRVDGEANFRVYAYASREENQGQWYLRLRGRFPAGEARIEVSVSGWTAKPTRDITTTRLGSAEPIDIALTGLGDPTSFFETRTGSRGATIVVESSGQHPWRCEQFVAGPALSDDVYDAWSKDREHGLMACIGRTANLYRSRFRQEPSEELVHDAVNNAVLNVFRKRYLPIVETVGTVQALSNEVMKQVVSRLRDLRRPLFAVQKKQTDGDPALALEQHADVQAGRQGHRLELRELVAAILDRLPPRERRAAQYKYIDEMSWEETAQLMGITVGGVKASVHRVFDELLKWFRERGLDYGDFGR